MEEHLKTTHMFIVRPNDSLGSPASTTDEIKWKIVTQLVEDYTTVHPKEIKEIIYENKVLGKISKNSHASSQEGIRYALRCPPGLVRVIERKFPDFFIEKKTLHKFMETFKAFNIPENI